MPTLREKMKEEMILVGLAQSTQEVYLKAVIRLNEYYHQSPAKLSTEEIRSYLLYLLKVKKLAPNTYNTQIYALRFFYCITLRQPLRKLDLPTTKITYKLPSILSAHEVERIIKATGNIKHRTLLMVIYSAGLRVSEAVNLRMQDIDSARMILHIRGGKGGKIVMSFCRQLSIKRYTIIGRYVDLKSTFSQAKKLIINHCQPVAHHRFSNRPKQQRG